jgi:hypothetical protein
MTVSAVSHYRGGTIDVVAPLAKTLKAVYLKHGVAYRLSRFETGPNVGDWLVVVQYADMAAYEKAPASFAQELSICCPLSRRKRTSLSRFATSALCQKQTHAAQQTAALLDHLVGTSE